MIKHVSLALHLRDGFRGKPIESIAGIHFTINGAPVQPIFKDDGWCVFIDLPKGEQELLLTARRFSPWKYTFTIDDAAAFYREEYVTLEPTREYPFGMAVSQATAVFLVKRTPLREQEVYIAAASAEQPLKLAQDGVKTGFCAINLFSTKKPGLLGLPDQFLIDDGEKSEVVTLSHNKDAEFLLAAPLRHAHARGVAFRRVRRYRTDAEGKVFLAMPQACEFTAYCQGAKGFAQAKASLADAKDGELKIVFERGDK